jgi:hypothetical protein
MRIISEDKKWKETKYSTRLYEEKDVDKKAA